MMYRYMKFAMAAILMLFFSNCGAKAPLQTENDGTVPRLSVNGTSLVDEQGNKVLLRGVSYGWHNWWPRFYNPQTVAVFADEWNCNVVRVAMGVEPEGGYLYSPDNAVKLVTSVADAAIEKGIYVIIDWHSHGLQEDAAKRFFAGMARRYKGVPNVIYEIFNEPVDDSWKEVKAYSESVIKTIRAIDSQALILVGSPHWDQDLHLVAADPIRGFENLMYTLHFYAGTHKKELRNRADFAISENIPIFISECAGMNADGNGPVDYNSWTQWRIWMEKRGLSFVVWSVTDKDESCSMLLPDASSTGPWEESCLNEWGVFVKNMFTCQ